MIRAAMVAGALLSALLGAVFPAPLHAQHAVDGRVTSTDLRPLPGVHVRVDSAGSTLTDAEGRYRIIAPNPQDTLRFSMLGYAEQSIPLDGRAILNVVMEERAVILDDLVVTGYGSRPLRAPLTILFGRASPSDLTCDGAALPASSAFDPGEVMPQPGPVEPPSVPIPNACAVVDSGSGPTTP